MSRPFPTSTKTDRPTFVEDYSHFAFACASTNAQTAMESVLFSMRAYHHSDIGQFKYCKC